MNMTFRWYGQGNDTVTLEHIKQIPGVKGIVWALHDKPAGEAWSKEDIKKGYYRRKRVFFIDAKVRGEVSYGRGGDVHY